MVDFPFPCSPPLLMHSLVPSKASTARTVPFLTMTVWPISSRLVSLAMRIPNSMSATRSGFGFFPITCPSLGRRCSR